MNDMSFTRINQISKNYDKNTLVEDIREEGAKKQVVTLRFRNGCAHN